MIPLGQTNLSSFLFLCFLHYDYVDHIIKFFEFFFSTASDRHFAIALTIPNFIAYKIFSGIDERQRADHAIMSEPMSVWYAPCERKP